MARLGLRTKKLKKTKTEKIHIIVPYIALLLSVIALIKVFGVV